MGLTEVCWFPRRIASRGGARSGRGGEAPRLTQPSEHAYSGSNGVQPLRQRTGFEPDARNRQTKPFKESDERFRLARDFGYSFKDTSIPAPSLFAVRALFLEQN